MGPLEVLLSRHVVDPPVSWDRLRRWLKHELEALAEPVTFGSLGKVLDGTIRRRAGGLSEMDAIANAVEITLSFMSAGKRTTASDESLTQDVLPVPISLFHGEPTLARLLLTAQNYLFAGTSRFVYSGITAQPHLTEQHQSILDIARRRVERLGSQPDGIPKDAIFRKLGTGHLTYGGPGGRPHALSLVQIAQGLPPEGAVGRVPLEKVVPLEVAEWLNDPRRVLKSPEDWPLHPPRARVNASNEDWCEIVSELHRRGAVRAIAESEIFSPRGRLCLNGAFGVVRPADAPTARGPGLRFIVNLIPTNSYIQEHLGEVSDLPMAGQWVSVVLLEDQVLWVNSDDQKGSFHLFRVPVAWHAYFAFEKRVPGTCAGLNTSQLTYVAMAVCPMGWLLAVKAMQAAGRHLAVAPAPEGAGLTAAEHRGNRAMPLRPSLGAQSWFHVYLDNWDQFTIGSAADLKAARGRPSAEQARLREAWASRGVLRSAGKEVVSEPVATSLGTLWDGERGTQGPEPKRLCFVLYLLLYTISQPEATQLLLWEALGHVCHVCSWQRPLFSALGAAFHACQCARPRPLPPEVVDELLIVACMLPSCVVNLRAAIDPRPIAFDACEFGGGACEADGLTPVGAQIAELCMREVGWGASGDPRRLRPAHQGRYLLVAVRDSTAAARAACDLAGLDVTAYIFVSEDAATRRIARSNAEVDEEWAWARECTQVALDRLATKYAGLHILVFCKIKRCSQGAHYPGISAFGTFWRRLSGRFAHASCVVEACSALEAKAADQISGYLGVAPMLLDARRLTLVARSSLYWCAGFDLQHLGSLQILGSPEGSAMLDRRTARVDCEERQTTGLLNPGALRADGRAGSFACTARNFSMEQVIENGSRRGLAPEEVERLLGFCSGHTREALGKSSKSALGGQLRDARLALLDGATSPLTLALLLQGLARRHAANVPLDPSGVRARWAEAEQLCTQLDSAFAELANPPDCTPRPSVLDELPAGWSPDHALVYEFFRNCDVRGTDVRLNPLMFYRAHAWPRQPINTLGWKWKTIQRYRYRKDSHINELELRTFLNYLRWRARRRDRHRARFLSISDSQVTVSVQAKGRSSSIRLNAVLRRVAGISIACDMRAAAGWTKSEWNPADAPSRHYAG